jgi:hypothetical protein
MALTIDQLQIQIEAESTTATQALDILISKLKTLQSRLNGLGCAGKNAGKGLQETAKGAAKADAQTNKYASTTNKASKSTKSFTDRLAQQISKTRTLYGAFKSAANMMGSWLKESNDYIETVNLFNVTMGDAAPAAREYAKAVESAMGIDSKDFMQYQGVFKNLTAGFGVSEEDANKMSQNLTQLSYDMASFFNASSVEESFDKLSSAMSGQVKGLREYGIDTTVATLQEYALSKGIQTKVRNMSQAEKAMLRYNYILEQSTHMQGDMARTLVTPANALRVLEAQLTRMKRAFGNIISVIAVKVIPYVQAFVEIVTEAANKLATFFGFDPNEFTESSKGVATSWGDAEEGVEDYSNSLKKAQKQMMGFDELNIIKSNDSDSGSSNVGAAGGAMNMPLGEYDFLDGLKTEKLDDIKEKLKDILKWAGIIGATLLGWKFATGFATGMNSITSLFGKGGKSGGGGGGSFQMPSAKTVLKGLGNLGIIIGGVISLAVTMGLLMKIPGFEETITEGMDSLGIAFKGIAEIAIPLTLVASACYVLGKVGVGAIAKGFAGFAIVVAGVPALLTAIGALMSIPYFGTFLSTGVESVQAVFNGLYEVAIPIGLLSALIVALGIATPYVILSGLAGFALIVGGTTVLLTAIGALLSIPEFGTFLSVGIASVQEVFNGLYAIAIPLGALSLLIVALGIATPYVILSGLAGFALIVGGTTVLLTAIGALMSIPEFGTFLSTGIASVQEVFNGLYEVAIPIAALSALLIGLGIATPAVILSGISGFTIVVGGLEALLVALGALSQIDGFTWLVGEGGQMLMQIGNIIGGFAGSLVGGFAEGVSASFPQIGTDLSNFMTNAKPFFDGLKGIDASSAESVKYIASAILTLTAANVLKGLTSWITGENSLAGFGEELAAFGPHFKEFADSIDGIDAGVVKASSEAALSVAEFAKKIPNEGGLAGWFAGENSIDVFGAKLPSFGKNFKEYADSISGIDGDVVQASADAAKSIIEIAKEIPNSGGVAAWFAGNNDIDDFGEKLPGFGKNFKEYYDNIKGIDKSVIEASSTAAKSIVEIAKNIPNSGGVVSWFTGDNGIDKFGEKLPKFGADFRGYYDNVKGIATSTLKGVTSTLNGLVDFAKRVKTDVNSNLIDKFTQSLKDLASAMGKLPTQKNIGLKVEYSTWVSQEKKKVYEALGLSGWPSLKWYAYERGGFPDVGEMFIAREAGPELVGSIGRKTAVANNDQIISGIENGVYRAMVAANANNNGSGTQTIRIINEIDGDVVGEKVIKYHNGKVMQTGASPLLV